MSFLDKHPIDREIMHRKRLARWRDTFRDGPQLVDRVVAGDVSRCTYPAIVLPTAFAYALDLRRLQNSSR